MQAAGGRGWRAGRESARRLTGRTPLRVKLIAAVLALVTVALVVISVAGLVFLRDYLLGQAEGNLQSSVAASYGAGGPGSAVAEAVRHDLFSGGTIASQGGAVGWLPDGSSSVQWVQRNTSVVGEPGLSQPPFLPNPSVTAGASWLTDGSYQTVPATSGRIRYLVVALPDVTLNLPGAPTGTIILAEDVTTVYNTLGRLTAIDVLVSMILLITVGVVGVAVIRRSLRPLSDVEQTAQAIAAGDLTRRVPEHDPQTEVGRLGRSLNVMLAQIEAAFRARSASEAAARRSEDKMRQFAADASHELRTPLTAIRGFAEYYRQRGGVDLGPGTAGRLAPAELDRIMRRLEQESSRMGVLVEDLLLLARLDQQRPLERRTVDLLTLAADAVHDARVVAPGRDIHLTVTGGTALLVLGDEVRLRQVIGNLMSNAMAHTPDGTAIDVLIRPGSLDEARAAGPRAMQAAAVPALVAPAPAGTTWRALPAGAGPGEAVPGGSGRGGAAGSLARPDGQPWTFLPAGAREPSDTVAFGAPEPGAGGQAGSAGTASWGGAVGRGGADAGGSTAGNGEGTARAGNGTAGAGAGTAGAEGGAGGPGGRAAAPERAGGGMMTAGQAGGGPDAADAGGRRAAVLEVTDHGPGLSAEQAEHVFERFYRADQARTSGGTGLGLAIVAALTAAHGGAVWVESEPGHGATFRIALPLAPEALTYDDPEAEFLGETAAAPPPATWTVRAPGPDGQ